MSKLTLPAIVILAFIFVNNILSIHAASPIVVVNGSATVDGDPSEWNLSTDFVSTLNNAGDPAKGILGNAYMRYDCETQRLYILVLGGNFMQSAADAWATVDGSHTKEYTGADTVPTFAWVATGGYEATFSIAPGTYTIQVHIENDTPDIGAQSAALPGGSPQTGLSFTLTCAEVVPTDTSTDTATETPTDAVTDTPTATSTDAPTETETSTPISTDIQAETSTETSTPTPTDTPKNTPVNTPFLIIEITDTATPSPTATPVPVIDPPVASPTPTLIPTVAPTATKPPTGLNETPEPLRNHVYLPEVAK